MISSRPGGSKTGSRVDLAHTGIGIHVRRGAQRSDIRSAETLKRVLLAAKSVGYPTGPSGVYLAALFESMGIAAEIRAKSRQVPSGATVGPIIAGGEVEVGFEQMSELLHADGIDVIGPLPAEIQHTTVISCGISAATEEPDAARTLVGFLPAPTARDAIERAGLQARLNYISPITYAVRRLCVGLPVGRLLGRPYSAFALH
jgi:molybdate transport system substrate-binding protein